MKSWLPHRPVVYQQGLKGVQTVKKSPTSPNPVQESVKASLPETGKRTSYILTEGETKKGTTETRVWNAMVIAASPDGTICVPAILALTETALLTVAPTETGILVIIGNGLPTTPETGTAISIPTTTVTGLERNGAVSGGATIIIPATKALRVIGSGKRSTENSG